MIAWFRLNLALLSSRLVAGTCRLFHYPGTSLPGVIAMKLCPDAVSLMAPAYDQVLAVTGTNGKTTTANLLAHFLRAAGCSVANNAMGANMLPGVATALFRDRSLLGHPRSRIALLEVDEGSVAKVFAAARPELVIVTNYFRDQLDRYWELERTMALLREAVAKLPQVTLLLNADDPLVAAVGQGQARARYFGILGGNGPAVAGGCHEAGSGRKSTEAGGAAAQYAGAAKDNCGSTGADGASHNGETREGRFCQRCGTALTYNYFHFGQLGDYFCSNCGFRRPDLDYAARDISEDGQLGMSVGIRGMAAENTGAGWEPPPPGSSSSARKFRRQTGAAADHRASHLADHRASHLADHRASNRADCCAGRRDLRLNAPLQGFYNVYNILAAAAAAQELGVAGRVIQFAVKSYRPATGRMEDYLLAGRHCTLALIKNPVGANEVLKTVIQAGGSKALVIAINDLAADGRDVSWLWDADFACLADPGISKIICAGLRAADLAVCLKYAGVPVVRIELAPERSTSLGRLSAQPADRLYVLATYTNLFDYARLLGHKGGAVKQRAD